MPPGGEARGEGREHGCTEEHHRPPATGREGDALPHHPPPPFPVTTEKEFEIPKKKEKLDEEELDEQRPIPENALFEILSRVPYKSLCRFKFVQVAIYSSDTGRWTGVHHQWAWRTVLLGGPQCVFLNDTMYLSSHYGSVVSVDAEGKNRGEIDWSEDMVHRTDLVTVGRSQGLLHAWRIDNDNDSQLYVWVLEDSASGKKWTLKHAVKVLELFGRESYVDEECFTLFAIHPDRNVIYLTDEEETTVSYDMDSREVQVVCTAKELCCGVPYTPCFAEWSSGAGN